MFVVSLLCWNRFSRDEQSYHLCQRDLQRGDGHDVSVKHDKIGLFPLFTNPSKYSLQDVLLTCKVTSDSANISYSDYYSVHQLAQGEEITNNDRTLYAKSDMPAPFNYFILRDKGKATINIRATYRGVDEPFTFQADVYARKIYLAEESGRHLAIFNDAQSFANTVKGKFDVYVIEDGKIESYEEQTVESLQVEASKISDKEQIQKTIAQIAEESRFVKSASQENKHTPWYMYIVGVLLYIIFMIALLGWLYLCGQHFIEKKKSMLGYIGMLITTLIFSFSISYSQYIFRDVDEFLNPFSEYVVYNRINPIHQGISGAIFFFSFPFCLRLSQRIVRRFLKKNNYYSGIITGFLWLLILRFLLNVLNQFFP